MAGEPDMYTAAVLDFRARAKYREERKPLFVRSTRANP